LTEEEARGDVIDLGREAVPRFADPRVFGKARKDGSTRRAKRKRRSARRINQ